MPKALPTINRKYYKYVDSVAQESTADDYDFYNDVKTYLTPPHKVVRKYYKEIITPWTQPTLTENGTMGGSTMATAWWWDSASSVSGTAYTAFQPNTGQLYFYCDEYTSTMYIKFYIPLNDFMIKSLTVGNGYSWDASGSAMNLTLLGGADEASINDQLGYIAELPVNSSVTFDLASNTKRYKYYILRMNNGGHARGDAITIKNLLVTGQGYTIVPGTPEDYTYYKDEVTYYSFKY